MKDIAMNKKAMFFLLGLMLIGCLVMAKTESSKGENFQATELISDEK